jgi:hypothetical protein
MRAVRWFLADGHTVEQALDIVVAAAQKEWPDVRFRFTSSARFTIDGGDAPFVWPEAEDGKATRTGGDRG